MCTDDVRVTTFAIKWRKGEESVANSGSAENANTEIVEEKDGDGDGTRNSILQSEDQKLDSEAADDALGNTSLQFRLAQDYYKFLRLLSSNLTFTSTVSFSEPQCLYVGGGQRCLGLQISNSCNEMV